MILYGKPNKGVERLVAELERCSVGLRWGGPPVEGAINGQIKFLNSLETLQALQIAGIPHCFFTASPATRDSWPLASPINGLSATVLGRSLKHIDGQDIVINGRSVRENQRWLRRLLWTTYHNNVKESWVYVIKRPTGEWRIVGKGAPVRIFDTSAPKGVVLRTYSRGFRLQQEGFKLGMYLREIARMAVKACGYDMAVVKLWRDSRLIFDVDPKPSLQDETTLSILSRALRRQANCNPREAEEEEQEL